MTTLIGIAVDQGKLNLDDTVVSFFPDRTIANLDARKEAITVRHLLTMSSGLQCTRDGMENDTVSAMHASPDFVQFVLDLPMATDPGAGFLDDRVVATASGTVGGPGVVFEGRLKN